MTELLPDGRRAASLAVGLAVAVALGWPQSLAAAFADDLDLHVRTVGEGVNRVPADGGVRRAFEAQCALRYHLDEALHH